MPFEYFISHIKWDIPFVKKNMKLMLYFIFKLNAPIECWFLTRHTVNLQNFINKPKTATSGPKKSIQSLLHRTIQNAVSNNLKILFNT